MCEGLKSKITFWGNGHPRTGLMKLMTIPTMGNAKELEECGRKVWKGSEGSEVCFC